MYSDVIEWPVWYSKWEKKYVFCTKNVSGRVNKKLEMIIVSWEERLGDWSQSRRETTFNCIPFGVPFEFCVICVYGVTHFFTKENF